MSQRVLCSKSRVDYEALHNGGVEDEQDVFHESFSELPDSEHNDPGIDEATLLRQQIEDAKAENVKLARDEEIATLRQELAMLKQQNESMKGGKARKNLKRITEGGVPTLAGLRENGKVVWSVQQQLADLGVASSPDSSADESEEDTSRMVQRWPHSELSLSYVSKAIAYDELTMAELYYGRLYDDFSLIKC